MKKQILGEYVEYESETTEEAQRISRLVQNQDSVGIEVESNIEAIPEEPNIATVEVHIAFKDKVEAYICE